MKLVAVSQLFFYNCSKIPAFSLCHKSRPASFLHFLSEKFLWHIAVFPPPSPQQPPSTTRTGSSHNRSDWKPLCILFELGLRVVSGQECFPCLPAYQPNVNLIVKCNNFAVSPVWRLLSVAGNERSRTCERLFSFSSLSLSRHQFPAHSQTSIIGVKASQWPALSPPPLVNKPHSCKIKAECVISLFFCQSRI